MDSRVYVARCDSYERAGDAVERIMDSFGGVDALLGGRRRVLVKPNLIMPKKPDDAATTHPAVMEAVCAVFVKAGADVAVIDSTGGPHTKLVLRMLYGKTGMKKAAERSGARLSYDTASRTVPFPDGRAVDRLELLSPALDADLVVSVAKAKTHSFQSMTGCVKNMFGCVTGLGKPGLHRRFPKREDFAAMLVDICERVKPGFSILDGVWGMEGAGPTGGNPKHLKVILGGFSPYAVDLAQCHLMGLRQDSVYTINEACSRGLSPAVPEGLSWLGDDYKPLRSNFRPALPRKDDAVPQILDSCVLCGDCKRVCPAQCIALGGSKAEIDDTKCIRCYCCHEFCSIKAVRL